MKIPKNMLLRLLREAVESGQISRADLADLAPKAKQASKKIDPDVLTAVRVEDERHKLKDDGMRLQAQCRAGGYALLLLNRKTGRVVVRGIHVLFSDAKDVPKAADKLLTAYLRSLDTAL